MPGIFAVLLMEPLRPGYPLSRMENEMENLLCNIKFDCVPSDRVDGQMGKRIFSWKAACYEAYV